MKLPQPNLQTRFELRFLSGLGRWSKGESRLRMDKRDLLRQYIGAFSLRARWDEIDRTRVLNEALKLRRAITNPPAPDNAGGSARESANSGNVQPGGV